MKKKKEEEKKREVVLSNRQRVELFKKVIILSSCPDREINPFESSIFSQTYKFIFPKLNLIVLVCQIGKAKFGGNSYNERCKNAS